MRMKFVSRRTASKRCELIIRPRQRLPCLLSRKQWASTLRRLSGKGALELPPQDYDRKELLQLAMDHRPDLALQRANEGLAHAELRSDRAKGKPDASVFGGYERPDFGFSQRAFDSAGNLAPIRQTFNHVVFCLDINLPVFNRNQGAAIADTAAIQAARSQIAAVDLNLRHEVAQNLIRFNGAQAPGTAYRSGVL